ncbi:MAG: tRNA (N6-isopentenyl adenosine(37)-C2)-methylthiotransferase MiaB [Clostridiales bacterium]|nr:tRNA (N6-isopentenyl adenosine(37)-C2)-methylthiotransferase MiaB [Clostridiales bacterium]
MGGTKLRNRDEVIISDRELKKQYEYMDRVGAINGRKEYKPLAFVDSYGCQQNEADSEIMQGMLERMGYGFTREESEAEVVLINTCAVREHAEMRVLGNIGALSHHKRRNPKMIIAIGGCMTSQQSMADKLKRSFPYVDIVFSTHQVWRFPELLFRKLTMKKRVFETSFCDGRIAEGLPVVRNDNVNAWVSIMYGCNNFCSYCIVPYVRGRERSRDPEKIIEEIKGLAAEGYKCITLLGQNVNSYGKDLARDITFTKLLYMINDIEGDFKLRFMTSHPKDATRELIDAMASCDKLCKHLHLPVQSGSDRILKEMNRNYTSGDYLKLIEYAKESIPGIVLTSDIIVGFPGETEEDFEDTLRLIEKVGYSALFTFIYSKRPGTPAAEIEDPATDEEKQRRFDRLLKLTNEKSLELHREYIGTVQKVLVEAPGRGENYSLAARTDGGRLVHLNGDLSLVGSFIDVKITDCSPWALFGELA